MLTGQLFPSAGNILVQGKNILEDANFARSQVGYVPEFPEMYEYLTGKEMLEFVISVRGKGDLQRGMEIAGLGKNIDRVISEYSQGMRRKIAIAAALVAEPPILVLDEALNGLDPSSVKRMTGLLSELRQEGTAIILSTHILDYLEKIATRLLYLVDGKLEADCSISDLQRIREML
jgi:ABC-type multidrug transport system ATPase subunit